MCSYKCARSIWEGRCSLERVPSAGPRAQQRIYSVGRAFVIAGRRSLVAGAFAWETWTLGASSHGPTRARASAVVAIVNYINCIVFRSINVWRAVSNEFWLSFVKKSVFCCNRIQYFFLQHKIGEKFVSNPVLR